MPSNTESVGGTCVECGRIAHLKQYHPSSSKLLCPDCRRAHWQHWSKYTPQQRKDVLRARRVHLRLKVIEGYGGKCACCGETESRFLTIDHVNDDGVEDRKTMKTTHQIVLKIIRENYPSMYQVLCWNCNEGKRFEGVCPHQIRKEVARDRTG